MGVQPSNATKHNNNTTVKIREYHNKTPKPISTIQNIAPDVSKMLSKFYSNPIVNEGEKNNFLRVV